MNAMAERGEQIFSAALTSDVAQGSSAERTFYTVEAKRMGGQEMPSKADSSVLVNRNCHFPSAVQRWQESRSAVLIIHFEAPDVTANEAKTFLKQYTRNTEFSFLTFQQLRTALLEDSNKPSMKPSGTTVNELARQVAQDRLLSNEWIELWTRSCRMFHS